MRAWFRRAATNAGSARARSKTASPESEAAARPDPYRPRRPHSPWGFRVPSRPSRYRPSRVHDAAMDAEEVHAGKARSLGSRADPRNPRGPLRETGQELLDRGRVRRVAGGLTPIHSFGLALRRTAAAARTVFGDPVGRGGRGGGAAGPSSPGSVGRATPPCPCRAHLEGLACAATTPTLRTRGADDETIARGSAPSTPRTHRLRQTMNAVATQV